MAYLDSSGLYVKTGLEQTVPLTGGDYRTYGELREIELNLDLTKAPLLSAGPIIVNDQIFFEKNMVVQEVEIYTTTAATGSTATLDIGLIAVDRATEIDFNGFIAALAQSSTNLSTAGNKTVYTKGSTGAGALIGGSAVGTSGYICMNYNTAAFTAGNIKVRIRYFRP
jgi:acetaldehyde dehydrogenase (acetylating)